MKTMHIWFLVLLIMVGTGWRHEADAVRLKDIAEINGIRKNQLVGYGLVVGLDGSGDGKKALFTIQSLASMLEKMGVTVDQDDIKVKNVAAVMVTATLPPFKTCCAKPDQRRVESEHRYLFNESEHPGALYKNRCNNNFFLLFILLSLQKSGWLCSRYSPSLWTGSGDTWYSPGSRAAGVL